jgi:hypothetical protein
MSDRKPVVWDVPGSKHLVGKDTFDGEILR